MNTGRAELAVETLNKMVAAAKTPSAEIELFRGDILAHSRPKRIPRAPKRPTRKLSSWPKDDPAVAMQLAEFLMASTDPGDDIEAEKLLRQIERQDDPARRAAGSSIDVARRRRGMGRSPKAIGTVGRRPGLVCDRVDEAKLLTRRGGGQNLEKAATICQELLDDAKKAKRPLPGVSLMLAQVRELQGNMDEARKQYLGAWSIQRNPSSGNIGELYRIPCFRCGPAERPAGGRSSS